MDKKDLRFRELHGTLDVHFHQLHSEGIGRQVQHAEIITKSEENQLWKSGVMGTSTPRSLQNAVFYYVGKLCCLRGGQEHRALKLSQLKRHMNPDQYTYYENVSKNRNGTFKQLHVKEKEVPIYACPEFKATERCPVYLLDMYISKLPPEAVVKDLFYLRPLDVTSTDPTQPWYSSLPVGKHTLNEKVKKMCSMAGIPGRKTNHSLRATGATEMYESGAPEKLIQERTGHRSLEALRSYERTSAQHLHMAKSTKSTILGINPSASQASPTPSPGISFQNLHGCTINITMTNLPPQPAAAASLPVIDLTETEIDELFQAVGMDSCQQ